MSAVSVIVRTERDATGKVQNLFALMLPFDAPFYINPIMYTASDFSHLGKQSLTSVIVHRRNKLISVDIFLL